MLYASPSRGSGLNTSCEPEGQKASRLLFPCCFSLLTKKRWYSPSSAIVILVLDFFFFFFSNLMEKVHRRPNCRPFLAVSMACAFLCTKIPKKKNKQKDIIEGGKSFRTLHTTTGKSQSCPVSLLLAPQAAHNWHFCLTGNIFWKHFLELFIFCSVALSFLRVYMVFESCLLFFSGPTLSPLQLFYGNFFSFCCFSFPRSAIRAAICSPLAPCFQNFFGGAPRLDRLAPLLRLLWGLRYISLTRGLGPKAFPPILATSWRA